MIWGRCRKEVKGAASGGGGVTATPPWSRWPGTFGSNGDGCGSGAGHLADGADCGAGEALSARLILPGNNPSSEPAAADGLGPNGAAFKQSCVFTLIGMKPRWRMDGMGAEACTCKELNRAKSCTCASPSLEHQNTLLALPGLLGEMGPFGPVHTAF